MRIGVDIHAAAKAQPRGVPHYVEEVVTRLVDGWPQVEWQLLHVGGEDAHLLSARLRRPGLVIVPQGRLHVLAARRLMGRTHDEFLARPGVMFLPAVGPTVVARSLPTVITVHDMFVISRARQLGLRQQVQLRASRWLSQMAAATILLANSRHTKHEVLKYIEADEAAVRVVRHGVDDRYFERCPPDELREVLGRHSLRSGYILHLGAIERRKNLAVLLAAFRELRRQHHNVELVLAGGEGPGAKAILASGIPDGVRFLGIVDSHEKRALYSGASVYCSVSHAEGLGLTPLEALACGTPPVVSTIPAFQESFGHGGAMFVEDASDVNEIRQRLQTLLFEPEPRRAILGAAAHVLSQFRWSRCAAETYDALREAGERGAGPLGHSGDPARAEARVK